MENRNNRILLGAILLILGVVSLMQNFFNISFGSIALLIIGLSFLMLYQMKHKTWSLILGAYITYFSLSNLFFSKNTVLLQMFNGTSFFLVPGLVFLYLYLQRNKCGLLIPGSILFWIGVNVFLGQLSTYFFVSLNTSFLFKLCVGFMFLTIYMLNRERKSKIVFILSLLFFYFSCIELFHFAGINFSIFRILIPIANVLFSIILIVIAILLISSNRRKF